MRQHNKKLPYAFFFFLFMMGWIGYFLIENKPQGCTKTYAALWFYAGILFAYLYSSVKLWFGFGKHFMKMPQLRGEITVKLCDDVFWKKGDFAEAKFEWQYFVKFMETGELMILYTSPSSFFIFPKRSMSKEMVVFVREKISHGDDG